MPDGICINPDCYRAKKKDIQTKAEQFFKCSACKKPLQPYKRPPIKDPAKVKSKDVKSRPMKKKHRYPQLPNIKSGPASIAKQALMVPMGCCGFLWNPEGTPRGHEIRYLGTTGIGPCVAFCLFDIGTRVSLVSHFESTSLKEDDHFCFSVAVELACIFLGRVFFKDKSKVSYFRCWIVLGTGPDKTGFKIAERLKDVYKLAARDAENSELIYLHQSKDGTLVLDTRLGDLYNVPGVQSLDRIIGGYAEQVEEFNSWTGNNQECGVLWNLEVPPTNTDDYPCREYQG